MFSILGDLFGLVLRYLSRSPRRIVHAFDRLVDDGVEFFHGWLNDSLDSTQRTISSARWSVGPPVDWLTLVQSFLRPIRLAHVRVPTRRSIR